jgi:hypothetical protein
MAVAVEPFVSLVGKRKACINQLVGKETRSATPTWPLASRPPRHLTAQML